MNPSLFHIMTSLLCVILMTSCVTSHLAQRQRDESGGDVEQPQLVFGRRNMNPNMNSLFFGKRTMYNDAPRSDKGPQRTTRVLQTGSSYNPNRNSLFFGKRQPTLLTATLTDLRTAVSVLNTYLADLEESLMEDE